MRATVSVFSNRRKIFKYLEKTCERRILGSSRIKLADKKIIKGRYTYKVHENCPISQTSTLLVHLRPKFFPPLDLGRPISNEPLPPLQMITKNDYYMLSSTFFRSAFVSSINSVILSAFPLTSFHLGEVSPSAFSWLYTLVCAVVQNITKSLVFIIIHIFSSHFAINLFYLRNLKT